MLSIISIVLQEAVPGQAVPAANRMLPQLIMITAFIAIFYFLILRPQRKTQQEHRAMVEALKKGDEIMTEGGIIGQVVHLAEDRITIKTAENTRIVVARAKVSRVMTGGAAEAK